MFARSLFTLLVASLILLTASSAAWSQENNAPPKEAQGFVGTLDGTVVAKKPNGNTVTITVTKVTPAEDNAATDSEKLVGQEVLVTVRWEKTDGKWQPMAEDQKAVKAFKKGDAVTLAVKTLESPNVLRMTEAPRKADAE